jgi:micrococcal nuclease
MRIPLFVCIAILNFCWCIPTYAQDFSQSYYIVTAVIDGDTIVVDADGVSQQIRLLGIDTPEVTSILSQDQCFGHEATMFTLDMLRGRKVMLSSDPLNRDQDDLGRWLRYVDIPTQSGSLLRLNELLVKHGFAFAAPEYPLSQVQTYVDLAFQAQIQNKGMWGVCDMVN